MRRNGLSIIQLIAVVLVLTASGLLGSMPLTSPVSNKAEGRAMGLTGALTDGIIVDIFEGQDQVTFSFASEAGFPTIQLFKQHPKIAYQITSKNFRDEKNLCRKRMVGQPAKKAIMTFEGVRLRVHPQDSTQLQMTFIGANQEVYATDIDREGFLQGDIVDQYFSEKKMLLGAAGGSAHMKFSYIAETQTLDVEEAGGKVWIFGYKDAQAIYGITGRLAELPLKPKLMDNNGKEIIEDPDRCPNSRK